MIRVRVPPTFMVATRFMPMGNPKGCPPVHGGIDFLPLASPSETTGARSENQPSRQRRNREDVLIPGVAQDPSRAQEATVQREKLAAIRAFTCVRGTESRFA